MKTKVLISLLVSTTFISGNALAQAYQWKDANGKTIISDTPPPAAAKARSVQDKASSNSNGNKSFAEQDLEFRKRQQANKEKEEKLQKEAQAKLDKQENCTRAKQQFDLMNSGQKVVTRDTSGEKRIMEDNERASEAARAQRTLQECK